MRARGFGATHFGSLREINEDAILIQDYLGAFAVCDGLGGHAAGERASRTAVETAEELLAEHRDLLESVAGGTADHQSLKGIVEHVVREAGARTYQLAVRDPECSGMACTMTLLVVAGQKAAMAHVGDTRLYLYRDSVASQLSSDHTMAADRVRRGEMTPAEAGESQLSNSLTRALGAQEATEVDTLVLDVLPDDVFLLCSDGLTKYVEGVEEMSSLLGRDDHHALPDALVDLANERGGDDNISAVVVRVEASDEEQEELRALSTEVRDSVRALRELDVFKGLRFADRLRILDIAEVTSDAAGDVVIRPGDPLDGMLVPISGSYTVDAGEGAADEIGPGDHVAETSLLVGRASRMTVRARETSRALWIRRDAFERLAKERPRLGVTLFGTLAERLGAEVAELGGAFGEVRRRRRWLRWSLS